MPTGPRGSSARWKLPVALGIPVATIAAGYLLYEVLIVPILYSGGTIAVGWWIALGGMVPVGLIGAGVWLAYRRAAELLMVSISAPGFLKLDRDPWSYWTWSLAG